MADKSAIEWTDATWNPVRGCSRVSPGCGGPNHEGGCYAEKIAARFSDPGQPFHGFAERTPHGGRWTGKLALVESALTLPLRWRKPRKIFVNSMSDLFHPNLTDAQIDRVFAIMALSLHTFQVLTKRADRMRAYCSDPVTTARVWLAAGEIMDVLPALARQGALWGGECPWPLRNVWLGVSAEDQEQWDSRVSDLGATPAAVRFVSVEPMLEAIDVGNAFDPDISGEYHPIDWVVCGGESGPCARPMHPDWVRALRGQCPSADVAFYFKQWGEWTPGVNVERQRGTVETATWFEDGWFFGRENLASTDGHIDDEPDLYRVGKKAAGRLLDGRTWDEFPEGRA